MVYYPNIVSDGSYLPFTHTYIFFIQFDCEFYPYLLLYFPLSLYFSPNLIHPCESSSSWDIESILQCLGSLRTPVPVLTNWSALTVDLLDSCDQPERTHGRSVGL